VAAPQLPDITDEQLEQGLQEGEDSPLVRTTAETPAGTATTYEFTNTAATKTYAVAALGASVVVAHNSAAARTSVTKLATAVKATEVALASLEAELGLLEMVDAMRAQIGAVGQVYPHCATSTDQDGHRPGWPC